MNVWLVFLFEALGNDARIPGFQGIMITPGGIVNVVYQHGMRRFNNLEELHTWAVGEPGRERPVKQDPGTAANAS